MLAEIEREFRLTGHQTGRHAPSPALERALARVPREAFVPADLAASAYDNRPLPIGSGQTISQPFIVALMTDCLDPRPEHRVLEIGTGCGYQAAVLAEIVASVHSIEARADLAATAAERLAGLGYDNVTVRQGDGRRGWPEQAPFDGVIVTAAAEAVPPALVEQLAPGGRLVIPVEAGRGAQQLRLIHKQDDGRLAEHDLLAVAFVPLTGRG